MFKPMWGIKDGDGVISLTYEENKNVLYATTWNGRGKMDARDGALYEYSLAEEDDVFVLLKRDLAAIWHLEKLEMVNHLLMLNIIWILIEKWNEYNFIIYHIFNC